MNVYKFNSTSSNIIRKAIATTGNIPLKNIYREINFITNGIINMKNGDVYIINMRLL